MVGMRVWRTRALVCASSALLAVSLLTSCTRNFYRQAADKEGYALVDEKAQDPRWNINAFSIEMDPRSRFFDPYNRTYPPLPPDDPQAHQLMHRVYGMRGWRHWHDYGEVYDLESPGWKEYLGEYTELAPDGSVVLTLETAVRLAYVHSPDFQQQMETLYLAALDVSSERYRFVVQFFGSTFPTFTHHGKDFPGGPGPNAGNQMNESDTLVLNNSFTAQKFFPTAGQLVVGFANTFVWQFAGPNTNATTSMLNFSLIQPLLQAGGRVIGMETLTLAERTLLYAVRAMVQYRQGFFTQIAIGDFGVPNVQRKGGFTGGTGLTGFSGSGNGGFGNVGAATTQAALGGGAGGGQGGTATGGGIGLAGGGAGGVNGFVGLLQQLQQNRNLEDSLETQLHTLALLEADLGAGIIDIGQVDQFRQTVETSRASLMQQEMNLQNTLDAYKISLGLPPELPMTLDDSLIRQFQFIPPATVRLTNKITDYIDQFGKLPADPAKEALEHGFAELASIERDMGTQMQVIRSDIDRMFAVAPTRLRVLSTEEQAATMKEQQELPVRFADVEQRFATISPRIVELQKALDTVTASQTADGIVGILNELSNLVGSLTLVQARARIETVTLDPIAVGWQEAIDIARANRLDWMNNRGSIVDTWRTIEFLANALRAGLNVVFNGEIDTLGNNPFRFRGPTGELSAGLQFTPPLTRRLQRNSYRQQLIIYQQTRRSLVRYEDNVKRNLRSYVRMLRWLEVNMEIQRKAAMIATRRFDQAREIFNQPPAPVAPGQTQNLVGPTSTLNLINTLTDLRNAQNNFMSIWLNYYETRMQILREMGVMKIDPNGMWIDEPFDPTAFPRASAGEYPIPPDLPQEWIEQAQLTPEEIYGMGPHAGPAAPPSGGAVVPPPNPPSSPGPYDEGVLPRQPLPATPGI